MNSYWILILLIFFSPAAQAGKNSCKPYRDQCLASGVQIGYQRLFGCEIKLASQAGDRACLKHIANARPRQRGAPPRSTRNVGN